MYRKENIPYNISSKQNTTMQEEFIFYGTTVKSADNLTNLCHLFI